MTQVQAGISSTWKPIQDLTKIGTVSRGQSLVVGESGEAGVPGEAGFSGAPPFIAPTGLAGLAGEEGSGLVLPAVFCAAWLTAQSGKLGGREGVTGKAGFAGVLAAGADEVVAAAGVLLAASLLAMRAGAGATAATCAACLGVSPPTITIGELS